MNSPLMNEKTVSEKLASLRQLMKDYSLDAYIIANADPHNSEYAAPHWMGREWLSGFHGSNGTVVVTATEAGLWTDSRYFIIAEADLEGTGIKLFRMGEEGTPTVIEWVCSQLKENDTLGFYGGVTPAEEAKKREVACERAGIRVNSENDLLDLIWDSRPKVPCGQVFDFPVEFAGESREEKIVRLRNEMTKQKVDWHLIVRLDEICWLLNIRGTDMEGHISLISFVLAGTERLIFFIDRKKLPAQLAEDLLNTGIELADYKDINQQLMFLTSEDTILLNDKFVNQHLVVGLENCRTIYGKDIITDFKTIKNPVEINHFRECLRKDGLAMARFYTWLDEQLENGSPVSELSISDKLDALRAELPHFLHRSFSSIVGYNGNGAKNHYFVTEETDTPVFAEGSLLIDNGGTYFTGTTDTTRIYPLSEPSEKLKKDYTAVLKGVISLSTTVFTQGTTGAGLDAICRRPIWAEMRNFTHGTGHGVGFCLNVHEGPQNINRVGIEPLKPGMVTTVEPGLYRPDEYGIRIENMILCVEKETNEFGTFLEFETMTRCPINTQLVEKELLTEDELKWLNNYNQLVCEELRSDLNDTEVEWLEKECRPL